MDPADAVSLEKELVARGRDVDLVKKAVCLPMSRKWDVGMVLPEAWQAFKRCRRQLTWQLVSPFAGMTLVISATDLAEFGLVPETIIEAVPGFKAPRKPTSEEIDALIAIPEYQEAQPEAFTDFASEDPADHKRWMRMIGLPNKDFVNHLFRYHAANHANFFSPSFFVDQGEGPVPYSIERTAMLCSACLEFFNIIGRDFHKKLVVPCPGAVMFAGMGTNRYYEVTSVQGK